MDYQLASCRYGFAGVVGQKRVCYQWRNGKRYRLDSGFDC